VSEKRLDQCDFSRWPLSGIGIIGKSPSTLRFGAWLHDSRPAGLAAAQDVGRRDVRRGG